MSIRTCALLAVVPALIAAAMALLPWVSLEDRGVPMRWSGLGFYLGDDIGTIPAIVPLGWAVVVVAFEALSVLGLALFATGGQWQSAIRWFFFGLAALAAAVVVMLLVAVAVPSMVYGNLFTDLGAFAGVDDLVGGRDVLVLPTILGAVFWLVVVAVAAGIGFRTAGHSERSEWV
ncbi:MAG TPA: hypothetical protein PK331_16100 [Gordonia sp. (in: high G+C Gram-positive bacteria)]|uniref:hypothetical protein n=1 Tax=unclassified Gordonia (in: high G+C Gram-positive bacteria) TaxID=2657482 RepID=UPI000FA49BEC|nr:MULTISPECIES: hypothetical protein [unclassified Gordonia (in: high G+C Gram-positive bacteria)]RUP40742.1 MAG: hypothetical protein EKK60_03295 [Gordonia sp. (in: high G+C Gram-positive bacteria)]HNP58027.1 hypothetical protein [Gordonia sp. (in: high G+C Gram-positive bacteria)]HRC52435.1 hypothetical protein [Gordonia sp. (in: high G+C Gram-positive bacteria)]